MARWTVEPDPRLSKWIESVAFSIDEAGAHPEPVRVIPDGRTDLIFSVEADASPGRPASRRNAQCVAEVFGTKTGPLTVASPRRVENIAVSFLPGAARDFFDLPAHRLTDQAVALEDLWGEEARALDATISSRTRASDRKADIEVALLRRLASRAARPRARESAAHAVAQAAVDAILQSSGRATVQQLCQLTHCSERRLERIFNERVGVAPKRFSRLVRFDASRRALRTGRAQLDVALDFGFADQSHLLRDFRAFTGTTPSALFR